MSNTRKFILRGILLFTVIFAPAELWARTDGGLSRGVMVIVCLVFFSALFIYTCCVVFLISRRNKQSEVLLMMSASVDNAWSSEALAQRIKQAFFKIQAAWIERNQEIAQDYMSERLYKDHKIQTDIMIRSNRKNILERLNLKECKIVQLSDYIDNTKDSFWVYFKAEAIDYKVNFINLPVVFKNLNKPTDFQELWKFIRSDHGWVVDEIRQEISIGSLTELHSFVEA